MTAKLKTLLLFLLVCGALALTAAARTVAEYVFDVPSGKTVRDRCGGYPLNFADTSRFVKGDPDALRIAKDGDGVVLPASAFPGRRGALEIVVLMEQKPESGTRQLVSFYTTKGDGLYLCYRKNRLIASFYDRSAKKWYSTANVRPLPVGRFVRIGLTWELPGEMQLSIDGKPAGSVTVDVRPDFAAVAGKFTLGCDHTNKCVFPGLVRSLMFFSTPDLPDAPAVKAAPAAAPAPATADAPQTVAEYVFDVHIDEPLQDRSGNNRHPLNSPGETHYVKGDPDALRIAADGDGVMLPESAFPGRRGALELVAMLEKKTEDADPRQLVSFYSDKGDGFHMSYRKNRLECGFYDRSAKKWHFTSGNRPLPVGRFVRIGLTWELPGEIRLTVDGKPAGNCTVDAAPEFAPKSTFALGCDYRNKNVFPGLVRSLKIFSAPQLPAAPGSAPKAAVSSVPRPRVSAELAGMKLEFSAKELNLVGWQCDGVQYVNPDAGDALWELRLYDRQDKRNFSVFPDAAAKVSFRPAKDKIDLVWHDVRLPNGGKVTVAATVAAAGEHELLWRIETDKLPARYAVNFLTYPRIPCRPTTADPTAMHLCYPRFYGVDMPDPFALKTGRGRRFGSTYPGGAHWQFCFLYGDGVPGIYLHADDANGNYKEFLFSSRPEENVLLFFLSQSPEQRLISDRFVSAYPVRTAILAGNWYDAACRYRQWAIRQEWSALGTLDQRKDLPKWVFDTHIALRGSTLTKFPRDIKIAEARVPINRENFAVIEKELHAGGLCVWYNYDCALPGSESTSAKLKWMSAFNARPEQRLVPGVDAAVAQLKAAGIGTVGYLNSRIYDESPDPNHADTKAVTPLVMRNLDGSLQRYSNKPFDVCRAARGWQDRLLTIIKHDAVKNGFAGMYMDSFGRGQYFCWADNHGHAPGSATASVAGQRAMAKYIRAEMRKLIPGFVLSIEASVENFVDLIDFKLHHENIYEHAVPVWTKIYHDRQFVYGRSTSNDKSNRLQLTACFHIGALLGRIFCGNPDESLRGNTLRPELIPYYRQLIAMRKRFYAQIGVGEMLRPPVVKSDLPNTKIEVHKAKLDYPAVSSSAWRSVDGKACAFFANHTDKPANFTFTLDEKELSAPRRWVISDGEGNLSEKPYTGNSFVLPPLSVVALEF